MKQDLIDLITAGYELNNQLVGDEVVNYNKLNTINFQIIRNLVGEFTTSKDENGTVTTDTRLNDDYTETTIALNEIFNDYNTLTSNSGKGHSIIGGQGNHAEGFHNKLWGAYASNYNHIEGYDNKVYTGGMLLLGQNFSSDAEAQTAGYVNGEMKGYGNHIEGYQNNILFANFSHVEGRSNSVIKNDCGHAEGFDTLAYGKAAHAEGTSEGRPTWDYFPVVDDYATAVNTVSTAVNNIVANASTKNNPPKNTFSEGDIYTLMASKVEDLDSAIANGFMNYESKASYIAFAPYSYSYLPNSAFGDASHTEGVANAAFEKGSHTEGQYNTAASYFAHTEGNDNHTFGQSSHAEGAYNITGAFAILDTEGKDITRNYADSTFNDTIFDYYFSLFSAFSPRTGAKLVFDKASFTENDISSARKFIPRTGYQYISDIDDNYLNLNNTERSLAGVPFYGVMPWGNTEIPEGYQHAEGCRNVAFGSITHIEGLRNWAISDLAHIEGYNNLATYGANKFTGRPTDTSGTNADIYPDNSKGIHIEGQSNTVYGTGTLHIEGTNHIVDDNNLYTVHTEGHHHIIRQAGKGVHIEGVGNYSFSNSNDGAHIEGHEFEYGKDYKWEQILGSYGVREYNYSTHNDNGNNNFSKPNLSGNIKYGPTVGNDSYRDYYDTLEDGNTYNSYKYRFSNVAYSKGAHAEGVGTAAIGIASHAEGMSYKFVRPCLSSVSATQYNEYYFSYTYANGSHIEGLGNFIDDNYPYSPNAYEYDDGKNSLGSHAEGIINKIRYGVAAHTEGYNTSIYMGKAGHTEGISSYVSGTAAHAEGIASSATGIGAHAEGIAVAKTGGACDTNGYYSVIDFNQTRFAETVNLSFAQSSIDNLIIYKSDNITKTASTLLNERLPNYNYNYLTDSPLSGSNGTTIAAGVGAHAEGAGTQSAGTASHSEGVVTVSAGTGSHAEGILTTSTTYGSHAEGIGTLAVGIGAHAEGIGLNTNGATGPAAHTEGKHCIANGEASHSEGIECITTQAGGHSEGYQSSCNGVYGHAEGNNCNVTGQSGHVGGSSSNCYAQGSFVHGNNLQSTIPWQTVFGQYNILNSASTQLQYDDLIFVLGSGTAANNRKNAMEVDITGNVAFAGDILFAGGQSLSEIIEELRQSGGGSSGGASYSSADLNTY